MFRFELVLSNQTSAEFMNVEALGRSCAMLSNANVGKHRHAGATPRIDGIKVWCRVCGTVTVHQRDE